MRSWVQYRNVAETSADACMTKELSMFWRGALSLAFALGLLGLLAASAYALPDARTAVASATTEATDAVFPWVESGGVEDNWLEGLGFALLGLVGALVTIYLFLGDFLPSMGGKAEYDLLKLEISGLEQRRNRQLELRESYSSGDKSVSQERLRVAERLSDDLAAAISEKQAEASSQRRSLLALGLPIYVVLGAGFAVLFATNLLQAILFGFGWTAVAERFGMKRELDEKSKARDQKLEGIVAQAEESQDAKRQLETAQSEREALRASVAALTAALGRKS
jgi:hypothetical protein